MISYMTALEIYVIGNMAFIVIVMIEYILVLIYEDNQKKKKQKKTKPNNAMQEAELGLDITEKGIGEISTASKRVDDDPHYEILSARKDQGQSAANSIDKISRIILPVSCLAFNITFLLIICK